MRLHLLALWRLWTAALRRLRVHRPESDPAAADPLGYRFFEQIRDAALVTEHGRIVDANPAALEQFGYSREAMIGLPVARLLEDPEDEVRLILALTKGPVTDFATRLRTAANDVRDCLVTATARMDDGGRVIGCRGLARDVTEHNRTVAELRRAEQDYHGLFENAYDAIVIFDPVEETVLDVNHRACVLYGLSRDAFTGRSMTTLSLNPKWGERLLSETLAGKGRYGVFDSQQVRGDGTVFDVEINAAEVTYKGRRAILSVNRDFSHRRKVEKEIRESEERFRLLLESVTDYAIVMLDPYGCIVSWNEGAERITGYSAYEALGRSAEIFRPPTTRTLTEELASAAELGRVETETTSLRKDGSSFAASVTLTRIVDECGSLRGFAAVIRDISQRVKLAQAQQEVLTVLQEVASEWTHTFDAVQVPIVFLGSDLTIRRLNRAAQELAGRPFTELVHRQASDIAGEPWHTIARLARQTFERRTGERARATEGDSVWQVTSYLADSASPDGRVIVVAYDLTRVTKLEGMLRRSEVAAAMGAMVAGVAHEVRNPLFTISATIDAWEARYGDSEGMRRYAGPLRDQVERLNRLMSDLLEYGKPHPLVLHLGSLAQAIRAAANDCALVATERAVGVTLDLDDDLPPARIDASRIEQVFQNVIDNALRHTPAGGTVRVESSLQDGAFLCRVIDEGPGLSADDLERIFVPFYTRRRGGTGLGLAIARNIVMRHGGEIALANRDDRTGTTVTIRLPLAQTDETSQVQSAAW